MQVLLLGPYNKKIVNYLIRSGDTIVTLESKVTSLNDKRFESIEFIISFRYKYIIPKEIVEAYSNSIINLHISFLPWNKGADPNLWSFLEDTPKGVTIHLIDAGLDTGKILVQKEVLFKDIENETLKSTYNLLNDEIQRLFFETWSLIKRKKTIPKIQINTGSYHKLRDKEKYKQLLFLGWDTPVRYLIGKAKENYNE